MHAKPEWLPTNYKDWDALLTAAVRKGMQDGKAPARCVPMDLRKLARGRYRASARAISAAYRPHRRHRPAAAKWRWHHRQAGGPHARPLAALHHGLEQHRRVDREHRARRKRQSVQPLLPRPMERLVQRNHFCAALHSRSGRRRKPATRCACCHEKTGNRDQGSGIRNGRRTAAASSASISVCVVILLAAFVAIVPQLIRGNSCGHDFDVHLVSWLDCVNAWRHGIPYPHWAPSPNYGAGEPRFVFYPPLTWMLGAALGLILPWHLAPIALTFLTLAATGLATRALALEALDDIPATLAGCAAHFFRLRALHRLRAIRIP